MNRDDSTLLKEFAEHESHEAFAELVQRHVDFVYGAALRQTNGDSGMAADVTQSVFIDLVKKAKALTADISLPAWLHRATRLATLAALRSKRRRTIREQEAARMLEVEPMEEKVDWNTLSGVLDEVLDKLSERDRHAILLRYFRKQSFREISDALKVSEDAARMRVDRAIDKLRTLLEDRGVVSAASAVAIALTGQTVAAAPVGLSASIAQAAFATAASTSVTSILTIMVSTKLKIAIAAVLAAGVATLITHEHFNNTRLLSQIRDLESQINPPPLEITPVPGGTNSESASELARLREEHLELMGLRSEVSRLRQAITEAQRNNAAAPGGAKSPDEPSDPVKDAAKNVAIARMNYVTGWAMAIISYAQENGGMMPTTLGQAAKHYPSNSASVMSVFDADKFEITYSGFLKDIAQPERTIILREKNAFTNPEQTTYLRTYLFADGHSELHSAADGKFEFWEKQHMVNKE